MLKDVLTPKWQSKDIETRLQAISSLGSNSEKSLAIIADVLANETEDRLVETALSHFKTLKSLETLISRIEDKDLKTQEHIASYVHKHFLNDDKPDTQNLAFLGQVILNKIYLLHPEPVIAKALDLPAIKNLLNSNIEDQKKAILLSQIKDIKSLNALKNSITNKSSKTLIKTLIEENRQAEKNINEGKTSVEKYLAKIVKLSSSFPDNLYAAEVELCAKEWQQHIEFASESAQNSFNRAHKKCLDKLKELSIEKETQEELDELISDFTNTATSTLDKLLNSLDLDFLDNELPLITKSLESLFNGIEQNQLTVDNEAMAAFRKILKANSHHAKITEAYKIITSKPDITDIFQDIPSTKWHKDYQAHPLLAPIKEKLKLYREYEKERAKKTKELDTKINKNFRFLQAELRKKNIRASNQISKKISSLIDKSQESKQPSYQQKLDDLLTELAELKDLNKFATEPARATLCEKMERLNDLKIKPMEKFKKIQALQNEWRQIYAENPKDELGIRFRIAGEKAFEPCKEYFNERDSIQQENLNKRTELCDTLEAFIETRNWVSPDWVEADKVYSKAISDWALYSPVNKDDLKELQKRYRKLINKLKSLLSKEKSANIAIRTDIITEAKKLLELDNNQEAIESVKQLQRKWNNTGIVFHKENRALWNDFRSVCDSIFDRRKQIKTQRNQEIDKAIKAAQQLVIDIEKLASAKDDELSEHRALVKEKEQKIRTLLADFPKGPRQKTENALKNAITSFNKAFAGIKGRKELTQLKEVRATALKLSEIEETLLTGSNLNEPQQILLDSWQGSKSFSNRISRILTAQENPESFVEKEALATEELQLLAIQMEIACEVPTPSDYSQQRMDYQLQLLTNKKKELKKFYDKADILKLESQWLEIGPVKANERILLEDRKSRCLKAKHLE